MEPRRVRETAEKIGLPFGASPEEVFLNFGCILGLEWLGDDVRVPKGEAVAHWVSGDVLTSVFAAAEAPRVEFHPILAAAPWGMSATFERTDSGDPLEKRLWMASNWKFRLADGHELEVRGRFGVSREETDPDEDEQFARMLAKTMMGIV